MGEKEEWDRLRDQLINRASPGEPEPPSNGAKVGAAVTTLLSFALFIAGISLGVALSLMLATHALSEVWPSLAMLGLFDLFRMSLGLILALRILSASFRVQGNLPKR